jgi:hypothetical protein
LFIAIQIPLADLRPFLDSETARLPMPGWPSPQVDVEFVRAVGAVRERRRGGLAPWLGEGYYANATRALRFPPGFGRWPFFDGPKATRLHCVFRRYFSDGRAVARVEVGFGPRNEWQKLKPLDGSELLGVLASCLAVPVEVPTPSGDRTTTELLGAGRPISSHLLRSTTALDAADEPKDWWLRALRPTAIAVYHSSEITVLPRGATKVPLAPGGPFAHHTVLARGGVSVPVWLIARDQIASWDEMRRIRLHLFRLHAEREVLKWTLSPASEGRLAGANGAEPWGGPPAALPE